MTLCFMKDWKPKPRIKDTRNLTWRDLIYIFFPKRFKQQTTRGRSNTIKGSIASLQTIFGKLEHPLTLELKSKLNTSQLQNMYLRQREFETCKANAKPWIKDTRNLTWRHLICIFFPKHFEQQATQAERKYHQRHSCILENSSIPSLSS